MDQLFCQIGSERDALAGCIVGACLFNIIADGIIQLIIRDCAYTPVRFPGSGFGTDGIAEPVCADWKADTAAFGSVSAELFIYCIEAVACAQHGELIAGRFNLLPVYFTLKFTDVNSFYAHRTASFQKI